MKIDRRGFLVASSSAWVLARTGISAAESAQPFETSVPLSIEAIEGRDVTVYTTADNSNYRLSATDTIVFKHLGQPLETQICVFVAELDEQRPRSSQSQCSMCSLAAQKSTNRKREVLPQCHQSDKQQPCSSRLSFSASLRWQRHPRSGRSKRPKTGTPSNRG